MFPCGWLTTPGEIIKLEICPPPCLIVSSCVHYGHIVEFVATCYRCVTYDVYIAGEPSPRRITTQIGAGINQVDFAPLVVLGIVIVSDNSGNCPIKQGDISVLNLKSSSTKSPNFLGSINIYPTLANANINIESDLEEANISIVNTVGKVMLNKIMTKGSESINVSDWSNGLYIVKTESKNGFKSVNKIMIQH